MMGTFRSSFAVRRESGTLLILGDSDYSSFRRGATERLPASLHHPHMLVIYIKFPQLS